MEKYTGVYENNRLELRSRRVAKHAKRKRNILVKTISVALSLVMFSVIGCVAIGSVDSANTKDDTAEAYPIDNTALIPATSRSAQETTSADNFVEDAVSTTDDDIIKSSTVYTYYSSKMRYYASENDNNIETIDNEDYVKPELKRAQKIEEVEENLIETDKEETVEPEPVVEEIKEEPVTISKTAPVDWSTVKADSSNSEYEHYLEDPGYADVDGYVFTPEYNSDGSVNYFGYTYEDFDYLSQCIAGEAGYCSWKWQMYVGSVVLNRVKHTAFKETTIKGICLAPYQYSCFNKSVGRVTYTTPTEKNKAVAYELLRNGSVLPYNVVFQAEFTQGVGTYEHIGNTYFCYIDW